MLTGPIIPPATYRPAPWSTPTGRHPHREAAPRRAAPIGKPTPTDARNVELWTAFLGSDADPHRLTPSLWQKFITLRRSGEIDARGRIVAVENRKPARDRTIEADLRWLVAAIRFGCTYRNAEGRPLLRENPALGLPIPKELNPRQGVASTDRYEKVLAAIEKAATAGDERMVLLRDLFVVVVGTGRRLSAVRRLTYADLRLGEGPYGSICWPASTDKMGRESTVPIGPDVRAAIDRVIRLRPGIGAAPLFPSPTDPQQPIARFLADTWLRAAEKAAKVPHLPGTLWHAYRRGWATARKHLPAVDVAAAGGWNRVDSLQRCYQKADQQTLVQVVLGGNELREANGGR